MATKVLVFESDPAFAGELRSEFGKLGCSTTVVDDGNLGLQQAATERPDLILLAIELPRMNGFSVCNKLKKDPGLKDVPLIIMSTESSAETFEQHRKLRTRAEDYVHKPIAFGELMRHILDFIPLTSVQHESEGAIVIDDEIEIGSTDYVGDEEVRADTQVGAAPVEPPPRRIETVDADVDAFAESAFGRLTGSDAPVAPDAHAMTNGASQSGSIPAAASLASVPLVTRSPSVRPSSAPEARGASVEEENEYKLKYERAREELTRIKERFDEADRAFEDTRTEVENLRATAAEADRRAREVEELKARLASGTKTTAASSRDFLDLREALNRKDKEILTLKEQLSKKEKQIVEVGDRSLAAERIHADLEERLLAMERELGETREKNDSLLADRDLAKKASEDFRTRLEKTRADSEAKERQVVELRGKHTEDLAAAEDRFAAMRAELDQTLANERAEHARALDQSEDRRKKDVEQHARDHEAQLAGARNEWQAELARARVEADHREQSKLDELRAGLEAKAARDLASVETKAAGELAALEAKAGAELEEARVAIAKLERDVRAASDEREALRQAKGDLEVKLSTGASRIASLEGELEAATEDLTESKQRLGGESKRAEGLQAKWLADRQSLERAKDALALALAQIEEAEGRPIEAGSA